MKYWVPYIVVCVAIALIGCAFLMQKVKAHSETRQARTEQEIHEFQSTVRFKCRVAYPQGSESSQLCFERFLAMGNLGAADIDGAKIPAKLRK